MCLSQNGESQKSKFVDFREFKGWHCSVNWFFMHIEQQTDSVFHHQTCQAQFGGTRGPIGKLSEGDKILTELKARLESETMPTFKFSKINKLTFLTFTVLAQAHCTTTATWSSYFKGQFFILFAHAICTFLVLFAQ